MNKKLKDLWYIFSANFLNFLMGIVTGFLVPKFLGIDDYAYVKIFTFYITYVGISHLGLIDGIYIKYGSFEYDELPREKIRGYAKVLLVMQIIEAIGLSVIVSGLVGNQNRIIIFIFTFLNMIIINMTTLWTYINQITKRFKIFSINTILSKVLYLIGLVILILLNSFGYIIYMVLQTIINIIILGIYLYNDRELIFGKSISFKEAIQDSISLIKVGFFVLIGNFMSLLILGIDRLFIDRLFSLKDFAIYSFAYTLISLFYILLNSITTVIYPYLTRARKESYKEVYETIRISITLIMSVTLCAYFAIKIIVIKFLPQYGESFSILMYLVPTVIYSGQINILISNFYKVLNKTKEYTVNNIVALILAFVTNLIAYIIFKDMKAIAVSTLISFILWVLYSDLYFKKILKVKVFRAYIMEAVILIVFILCAKFLGWFIGAVVYLVSIIIFICIFSRKDIHNIVKIVTKKE
ncbi:oligosaccharide flippase family protein [uncultured Clostridium sp.]|uniref:oligosaccharide flippase family protein n=1 Tax=uncultured Clostridium sp. TaxID=59620 RepID=UPI00262EA5A6|nr:oligosaccharide flippase family protein [uncultured Clostridium sp.]